MPIIDMKNVTIFFEDGYSEAGAVNLLAGYTIGATSIVVDGFTGVVPVGARFTIAGQTTDYTVVSTTETSGDTTNIVFTPGLTAAVLDNVVITVYSVYLQIKLGDGNFTYSEKKPREFKKDRGILDLVRDADEEPIDVSFQLQYEELTSSDPGSDPPTPEDALKRRGSAADWVSAYIVDPCAPYCINIRFDHVPPNCSGFETERVILPYFFYEMLDHDVKAGTISVSGKCNAKEASVTRFAAA